jgi:glycosyltransferase involved in cell wall biosynthesis
VKLILLTQCYPFGRGEAFIDSELDMLRSHCSVTVVPAYGVDSQPRSMPGDVGLDISLATCSRRSLGSPSRIGTARRVAAMEELRRHGASLLDPRRAAYATYYLLRGGRAARWILGRHEADGASVLCYWSNAEAFGAALATSVRSSIRFACRAHRGDLYEDRAPAGYLPFRETIMERARIVLAVSDDGRRHLARRHPRHAHKVVTSRLCLRDSTGPIDGRLADAVPVVASCSTDAPVKRLALVAQTIAEVASRRSDRALRWVHAGLTTERLTAAFPGAIPSNLQVEGTGWLPADRVRATWRAQAPRVFVNLSSSEGVPVSIMEALSMGIPVVATAAGGTAELVDEQVGAILPVDLSAAEAARAVESVLERDPSPSAAARARYLERCAPESVGAAFVQRLLEAVAPVGPPP